MGSRYWVRTDEIRKFPLGDEPTTDYYVSNIFEVIKLYFKKRKRIIFIRRSFY